MGIRDGSGEGYADGGNKEECERVENILRGTERSENENEKTEIG